ncbi:hypothetical protein GQ44DRAFT_566932, partial [Phaeosphaeriaceae sp. PMI808]
TTTSVTTADDDPNALTNPKPDISVGLAHTSLSTPHQRLLDDVHYDGSLLSEPFSVRTGLHFPFLVVEAKGLGNVVSAQNQAAVGAASALNILDALRKLVPDCDVNLPNAIFSITTEGPLHELWVHHHTSDAYHSSFIDVWRTTTDEGAQRFVNVVARLLAWGASRFRLSIQQAL